MASIDRTLDRRRASRHPFDVWHRIAKPQLSVAAIPSFNRAPHDLQVGLRHRRALLRRDQMKELERVYLGIHRSAGELERRLENLLVVAPRVLLGVPYLRHLHTPVDFAGA